MEVKIIIVINTYNDDFHIFTNRHMIMNSNWFGEECLCGNTDELAR